MRDLDVPGNELLNGFRILQPYLELDRTVVLKKMRLLDDGRVLMLGAPGVRPLSFKVNWPVPGRTKPDTLDQPIGVSPLGRRALGLVSPRVDRARRAKAE